MIFIILFPSWEHETPHTRTKTELGASLRRHRSCGGCPDPPGVSVVSACGDLHAWSDSTADRLPMSLPDHQTHRKAGGSLIRDGKVGSGLVFEISGPRLWAAVVV